MKFIERPSPNFDSRGDMAPSLLVLHYTGMQTGEEAIEWLANPQSKVSAHYVVEEDGRIFHMVDESNRAWHAGVSSWRDKTTLNMHSIGIEIVNPGHEWGYRPFPEIQMVAVKDLCLDILSRHFIAPRDVVGHSDIAPLRKNDPGELFDWTYLAAHGIGLMPPTPRAPVELSMREIQENLAKFGYALPLTGEYDALTAATIKAFQQHFYPTNISGVADGLTLSVLTQLLELPDAIQYLDHPLIQTQPSST
jgi:N-acetylmuramoyl-L-alanine amidase